MVYQHSLLGNTYWLWADEGGVDWLPRAGQVQAGIPAHIRSVAGHAFTVTCGGRRRGGWQGKSWKKIQQRFILCFCFRVMPIMVLVDFLNSSLINFVKGTYLAIINFLNIFLLFVKYDPSSDIAWDPLFSNTYFTGMACITDCNNFSLMALNMRVDWLDENAAQAIINKKTILHEIPTRCFTMIRAKSKNYNWSNLRRKF